MAQCKWCNKSGWLVSVSSQGLCKDCSPAVNDSIQSVKRVISQSIELLNNSKNLETKLSRMDVVLSSLQELTKYEDHGIQTLQPTAKALIAQYTPLRDQLILEGLRNEYESAVKKAEVANTIKTKVNLISKVLLELRDFKSKANDSNLLTILENEISANIQKIQIEGFMEEANKAEFKHQNKKALDQYYEASYLLQNESIDSALRVKYLSLVEAKISELSKKDT
jgi:hypothetical protein